MWSSLYSAYEIGVLGLGFADLKEKRASQVFVTDMWDHRMPLPEIKAASSSPPLRLRPASPAGQSPIALLPLQQPVNYGGNTAQAISPTNADSRTAPVGSSDGVWAAMAMAGAKISEADPELMWHCYFDTPNVDKIDPNTIPFEED